MLAAPSGAAGVPTFRAMTATDVPTLNQNTTGSAASLSANLPVSNLNSGTGASASTFWRGDGTWVGLVGSGTYDPSAVAITGGTIAGITSLGVGTATPASYGGGSTVFNQNFAVAASTGNNVIFKVYSDGLTTGALEFSQGYVSGSDRIGWMINKQNADMVFGTNSDENMRMGAGGGVSVNTGAAPTARLHIGAGTAAVNKAPLKFTSGVNLTTPEAGTIEYDAINFYATNNTTIGRGYIPVTQSFKRNSSGTAITTIANFFGANSNIPLEAYGNYEIEITLWYLKTTASTVVFTLTNTALADKMNYTYEMSPASGLIAPPGAATTLMGHRIGAAAVDTVTTASLTTGVNHYVKYTISLANGTGTSLKIQATSTSGSITPLANSSWKSIRLPDSNTGTYAA